VKKLAGLPYMLIVSDRLASQTLLERLAMLPIDKTGFHGQINCEISSLQIESI
jgi:hypothetical protein